MKHKGPFRRSNIDELLKKYPEAKVEAVNFHVSSKNFLDTKRRVLQKIEGGAACILITLDNKIVLVKRKEGMWALPGGAVEHGEKFDAAVLREIKEECGVRMRIDELFLVVNQSFISPTGERVEYPTCIFIAYVISNTQPHQTKKGIPEGIRIEIFAPDALPKRMIAGNLEIIRCYIGSLKRLNK